MTANISKHIGERIRRAREQHGWTQGDLAQRLGKNATTVSNYENGNRTIRVTELPELARVLEVPIAYFFESEGPLAERLVELVDALQTQRTLDDHLLQELIDLLTAYLQAVSDMRADLSTVFAEIDHLKGQMAAAPGVVTSTVRPRLLTFMVEETSLKTLLETLIEQKYIQLNDLDHDVSEPDRDSDEA
jgi:transcriptional regulator with XRE-family HTH domain